MWPGRWASGEGSGRPCRPPGQASAAHATSGKSARILGRAEPRLADPHISRAVRRRKSRRKTRRSPSAERTQAITPGPSGRRARTSPAKGGSGFLRRKRSSRPSRNQDQAVGQGEEHGSLPARKDALMKLIAGRLFATNPKYPPRPCHCPVGHPALLHIVPRTLGFQKPGSYLEAVA
jgi:hypothetical protein